MNLDQAKNFALAKLQEHGLLSWSFQFDKAKRRFGHCKHAKSIISLSRALTELNSEEKVYDVLLHEIAHALAGFEHHHDRIWRETARRIGAAPRRCYPNSVVQPVAKWISVCPNCYVTRLRHKRRDLACKHCCNQYNGGKYDGRFKLQYKLNNSKSWSEIDDNKNSVRQSKASFASSISG